MIFDFFAKNRLFVAFHTLRFTMEMLPIPIHLKCKLFRIIEQNFLSNFYASKRINKFSKFCSELELLTSTFLTTSIYVQTEFKYLIILFNCLFIDFSCIRYIIYAYIICFAYYLDLDFLVGI